MNLAKPLLDISKIWLQRHAQVALASLGRLFNTSLASIMTCSVIGIALALPMGLHVILNNLQGVSGGWESGASISLFLKQTVDDREAAQLAKKLRRHQRIEGVELIPKQKALEEFRHLSGFAEALEALDANPLPALLVIQPKSEFTSADAAQKLVRELMVGQYADRQENVLFVGNREPVS